MKKQLIALRGISNSGKSTTLQILYKLLAADSSTKPMSFEMLGYQLDFRAIVAVGGRKVGIVNRGDVPGPLKEFIEELIAQGCTIIVCAARTKGDVEAVLNSFSPKFKLVEVPKDKSIADGGDILMLANQGAAHELAAKVYSAVAEQRTGMALTE